MLAPLIFALGLVYANSEPFPFEHSVLNHGEYQKIEPLRAFNHTFNFEDEPRQKLTLLLPELGKYVARVNWPASFPADMSLDYNDGLLTVTGSTLDVVPLRESAPRNVPFQIILSPVNLEFIPSDVIPMITGVATTVGIAGSIAYFVVQYIA